MSSRKSQYRTNIVLGACVLLLTVAVVWSRRQVPDSVREERQGRVLPTLRRENITRVEVALAGGERYELRKSAPAEGGHWQLIANGRSYGADEPEVERVLTEAEFAAPSRRLGALEGASRERFGLASPRARVTLREGERGASQSFAVGGLVADEQAAYVERDGEGFVVPRTFADAFVQRAMELRERSLSTLEPSRTARLELVPGDGGERRVLERTGPVWRLTTPAEGRAARARVEAMLNGLRDLRAARYVTDDADDAALARYGLAPARLVVRATRDRGGATTQWRFGGPCEGHDDEVAVARGDERTVACVGRAIVDDLARPASELRDDKLLWARTDEVERVRVHAPSGEFSLVRDSERWRMEGGTREADADAVENWLNVLGSYSAEARLDGATASTHGLAAPVPFWIEVTRTGVDGAERVNVGQPDADRMYASRDDEPLVLGFEPATTEALRVDPVRFRARRVVLDVPDEMTALVVEAPEFRDEAARAEGVWRLSRPFAALADPSSVRAAAQQIASLNAERWVASQPAPEHGLAQPRMRVVARFEGAGPDPEPGADGGATDAGARPRVREYTLNVGAAAPGGGFYASLAGRPGVFVMSSSAYGELAQPHLDRNVLEIDRAAVQRIEITRPRAQGGGTERVAIRRDGEAWRTDAGAPADRTRVNALLDQLTLVRAPRVLGYGPAPASAQLGGVTLTVVEAAAPAAGGGGDAGAAGQPRTTRIVLGGAFGAGDDAGAYARRDGVDATLSVPRGVADAVREFAP